MDEYIGAVARGVENPRVGLPDRVFDFIRQVTPMINVDLLVQDEEKGILLAWRSEEWGTGWHIPGGIIRFREPMRRRIDEVARLELAARVEAELAPSQIVEFTETGRGHFISLLFRCKLLDGLTGAIKIAPSPAGAAPGELHWFRNVPQLLYPAHDVYRHWWAS